MINEDKIILMTDLAIYEKKHDQDVFRVNKYFKWDYIFWNTMLAFIRYTFCFLMLFAGYVLIQSETLFYNINLSGFGAEFRELVIYYAAGLVVYLALSITIYSVRYRKAKRGMMFYATKLRRLYKRYNQTAGDKLR